jgi:hypothetical protein
MPRRKRWEVLEIKDGFGQVRFLRWRYFIDFINQEMLDFETYIWRGQRCDNWLLESTLDRLIKKAKIAKAKRPDFGRSHLEQFKYAARGRRGQNPAKIEDENEWWALGQHHGLATPLLDWTTSPFAAAYFAFIGTGDNQTRYRAMHALHRPSVETKVSQLKSDETIRREEEKKALQKSNKPPSLLTLMAFDQPIRPEFEFIRPRSDENQRLVNQSGLFTRAPTGKTLEEWVQIHFVGEAKYNILMKLLIPNRDREECLRMLNRMNINHLTLFPDLYGASKFCNLFGEIEKY